MRLRALAIIAFSWVVISAQMAHAAIQFDQNVTNDVIYGSGNSNGGFTTDRNAGQSIELGLRAHVRYPLPDDSIPNGIKSQGNGDYGSFAAGTFGPPGRASWNFDWSINSDYLGTAMTEIADFLYLLEIDYDPGIGTNFLTFDPIRFLTSPLFPDHSFGDNTTMNNGTEATDAMDYAGLVSTFNLVQNSWNLAFFTGPQAFDPNVDGTYTIQLSAYRGSITTLPLASTSIDVIVGAGGAVPEPLSLLTWFGLTGCAVFAAKRRQD